MLTIRAPGIENAISSLFEASCPVFRELAIGELRGTAYFPPRSERAIGAPEPDPKSYIEYIPGTNLPEPLMSTAANVHRHLLAVLRCQTDRIAHGIAPKFAPRLAALLKRAPAPILRITFYPRDASREIANYPHKDIDLVTFLPRATAPGLQMALRDRWHEIQIDPDSVIVLAGEMLELMGGPSAELHRVVGSVERISASFFINARPDEFLPNGGKAGAVLDERLRAVREAHKQIS